MQQNQSDILIYQTEDGVTKIETWLQDETVWLTQAQMADLFQKSRVTITEHVGNVFKEGELDENSVSRKSRLTAADGKNFETTIYNLDVIISVGYRVKSHRGTQFRIWATQRLREYIVKGFAMDDERLKQAAAAATSTSCSRASATSGRPSECSGARCWIFTRRALTTIRPSRRRRNFSRQCRTRCTGPRTVRR